jgi:GR25 family glycosyltransferase involved in LPS biosynthesis
MKYTIIYVNDRAIENMNGNHKILDSFNYIDEIEYFDGNSGNAWDIINHKGIKQDVWNPYDGRTLAPLPGELGVWVSTINVLEYIVSNKIDKMLVLEDDIILQNNFLNNFQKCLNDIPEDFDFFSLYYFDGQNNITEQTEIGSDHIHKSLNQYSAGQAILYSYSGAKKLLKLIYRKGIEYTTDCFIFKQSQLNLLNGYSIKGPNDLFLFHEYKKIQSLIDPGNERKTEAL